MHTVKRRILAKAIASIGVLVLIGLAISFAGKSPSTTSGAKNKWENVVVRHQPDEVKNMTRFGTVSVSMRSLSKVTSGSTLRGAALASVKQKAAKAGADAVLIQKEQFSLKPTPNVLLVVGEYKTKKPLTIIVNFVHEVVKHPRHLLPLLLALASLVSFWVALCVSGLTSLRTSRRHWRFWFALAPILFGLAGLLAQLPIHINAEGQGLSFNFRWLFAIPLVLGAAGLVLWWRARREIMS